MNNFYELLATDLTIALELLITVHSGNVEIVINNQPQLAQQTANGVMVCVTLPLLQPIDVNVRHQGAYVSSMLLDGWQARPQYGIEHPGLWQFTTNEQLFYHWKHQATGQGWLLRP
jgi:hypothetical protein